MQTLARLNADERAHERGGASIAKAKDLIDAAKAGANRQRLETDWSRFRDVGSLGNGYRYTCSSRCVSDEGQK